MTVQDAVFDGPGCLQVPLMISFTAAGSLDLSASKSGSSNTISAYAYSNGPENVTDALQVCPNVDGEGTYQLRGTVSDGSVSAPLPAGLQLTVSRAPTSMSRLTARQRGSTLTIAGKVTAPTSLGEIGARGTVTMQGMLPKKLGGTGKWVNLGTTYPDEFGAFVLKGSLQQNIKGAQVRTAFAGDAWCADATGTTLVNRSPRSTAGATSTAG